MEDMAIGETPYSFEGQGDDIVDKPRFEPVKGGVGAVFINKAQYFTNVPKVAWDFYIGGY